MKILSGVLLLVAALCVGTMLMKAGTISTSIRVGWDTSTTVLDRTIEELDGMNDPRALRFAAETHARLYDRGVQSNARYYVYFYASLAVVALVSALAAFLAARLARARL